MTKVALLVGVSEYKPGFQSLPSATKDVVVMQRVLESPELGNFGKNITVLTNPDRQKLEQEIENLFANFCKEDLLLFYFSGHGFVDQNCNLFLATSGTCKRENGTIIRSTAVAASIIQSEMLGSRSEYQVIILDCCFSGAFAKGLTVKDSGKIDIQAALGGKGRAILTSSSSTQYSFQQEGLKPSIYTQYLVEGIETGAADKDNDGNISADELHQYASEKVQQAAPAMTPQFYPVAEGYRIYLAKSSQNDPKLKYRKKVQAIAQDDQGNIDFIKGEIDFPNRRYLDKLRDSFGISSDVAKIIENEVMEPYRQRQFKLKRYKEALSCAIEQYSSLGEKNGEC